MSNYHLAISSCPNDTFIFAPLILKKITTHFSYTTHLQDIESLNTLVEKGDIDMAKISYAQYPSIADKYQLLDVGGAMGYNVGPLLVSCNNQLVVNPETSVLIPGKQTTAHKLFSLFYPLCTHKIFCPFHEIQDKLMGQQADMGVLIHEGRFTYEKNNFKLVQDLGKLWQKQYQMPLPLGGLVIKRSLKDWQKQYFRADIIKSMRYAQRNPIENMEYIEKKAQIFDKKVLQSHIKLYVNDFTFGMDKKAKDAISFFLQTKTHSLSLYNIFYP